MNNVLWLTRKEDTNMQTNKRYQVSIHFILKQNNKLYTVHYLFALHYI